MLTMAPLQWRSPVKNLLLLTLFAVLTLSPGAGFAETAGCAGLTITGHPEYPPIGYKDGDRIVGAGATLVERIAGELKIPVQSKYTGSWAEAQNAAREGRVDIIFGIYFNDERAAYLDYVRPGFLVDAIARDQLGPVPPSISGPNSFQVSPSNFSSCSCSIGDQSLSDVLILTPGR